MFRYFYEPILKIYKLQQTFRPMIISDRSTSEKLYNGEIYIYIRMQTLRQTKMSDCRMITPSQTGARVKLKGDTNCRTQNVVYLISCGKCGKQYVGETKGPLNIRMNDHRDDLRHKRFERSPVGEHFCSSGHDFISHASVCCLDSKPEWTDNARKSRESYWIRRLNTLQPSGINKGD